MTLPHDEAGSGPALVLLHAGIADRRMWVPHLEPLAAAGYRVVAIDLPGFGEAPPGTADDGPHADVLGAMDALRIDRAALAGSSFGGAVALRVAYAAPERVSALAIFSAPPPGLEPSPQLTAAWDAEEEALEAGDVDAAVEAVLDAWTLPDAPAELREAVAEMQRRAFELQATVHEGNEIPDPLEDDPGALGSIEAPVLVAAGGREMSDFREGAKSMAAALPNARSAEIASAGHLAPLETPSEFRALLVEFLDEPAATVRLP